MVIIGYEGKSDGEFFDNLLDVYELDKNVVTYYDFKGKDNLFNIHHDYYDEIEGDLAKIEKILLIVDADNRKDPNPNRGYAASKKKLKEMIRDLEFNVPIDYYIMCDEHKEGYLESFLLSILDNEQKVCINAFKACFSYELTDKLIYNTFYKQKKHPHNFEHPNFNLLKQKLINLFKEQK